MACWRCPTLGWKASLQAPTSVSQWPWAGPWVRLALWLSWAEGCLLMALPRARAVSPLLKGQAGRWTCTRGCLLSSEPFLPLLSVWFYLDTKFPEERLHFPTSLATAAAAAKSLQSCPTLCDPIDGSPPGSPSLGFSRQEHWSGLPSPSPVHESESEAAQSCLTLSEPMDCSPPGSSVHGIFQARALEWGAIAFSALATRCSCMILFWSVDVSRYVYVQPPQCGLKWKSKWLSSPFSPSHWLEDRCSDRNTSSHFDSDVTLVMEIARDRGAQRRSLLPYTRELLTSLALATSSLLNHDRESFFFFKSFWFLCFFCHAIRNVGF